MRYLYVPETITLKRLETDEPMTALNKKTGKPEPVTIKFHDFLVGTLLKDQKFGVSAVTIMHAIDIRDKVKLAKEESYVDIPDEAGTILKEAAKAPSIPFNTEIAIQLGPFLKAVLGILDELPEEPKEEKPKKNKK